MTDANMLEKLVKDFERSQSQIFDLVRLQDEITKNESELYALQIRYVHK